VIAEAEPTSNRKAMMIAAAFMLLMPLLAGGALWYAQRSIDGPVAQRPSVAVRGEALPPVEGYRYAKPAAAAARDLAHSKRSLGGAGVGLRYRYVTTSDGGPIALAMVVDDNTVDPNDPYTAWRRKLSGAARNTVQERRLARTPVLTTKRTDGAAIVSWSTSRGQVLLLGRDAGQIDRLATAMLRASRRRPYRRAPPEPCLDEVDRQRGATACRST
jgi:hypothetical protein